MLIQDFTYDLPPEKIALFPKEERDASKLLVYREGKIFDEQFYNLPQYLSGQATLVFNDTRVIEARLLFQKQSGGVIEIFCLEPWMREIQQAMQETEKIIWKCLIGGASKWKRGQVLTIEREGVCLAAHYHSKIDDGFLVEFTWTPAQKSFAEILHATGAVPLPPYIKRKTTADDSHRYQTIFNLHEGSVAAPTAALHFTEKVVQHIKEKNIETVHVTLHVGAGTFKPVQTQDVLAHQMHNEPFVVTREAVQKLIAGKNVIAVGTTSLRTIESLHWIGIKLHEDAEAVPQLAQWEAYELDNTFGKINYRQSLQYLLEWMAAKKLDEINCRTSILIMPGYTFKIVQGLITNFHQPQSTLLLLVAAFIGNDWKKIYQHALKNNYRFLSYGDSSYLTPARPLKSPGGGISIARQRLIPPL